MHTIAVDPGATGGAVLLAPDGRTVLDWRVWSTLARGFRLRGPGLEPKWLSWQSGLGEELAQLWGPARVVVEGLFVAHGSSKAAKGKRRSLLPLAEAAGELMGPLRRVAIGPILRPTAQREWRPAILHVPADCSAHEAEERAVNWARRNLRWVDPLPNALTYAEEGAVSEAACMASWAVLQTQEAV